jgi:anhydro-N-acetylmuramic acid kinase
MSGTSMDGVDAAMILTNGETVLDRGPSVSFPYPDAVQARFRSLLAEAQALPVTGPLDPIFTAMEAESTALHIAAAREALRRGIADGKRATVIGYHGQTVLHRPQVRQTVQLGSGALLAQACGVTVVNDFRNADVRAGGQGAPLTPLYHQALALPLTSGGPIAVLNIGGIANVTYVEPGGALIAFDTGPGNALIDDWARRHTGRGVDWDGQLARQGNPDRPRILKALAQDWFAKPGPKSLDRLDFGPEFAEGLSAADGAATLTAFTAAAVEASLQHFPQRPVRWIVCGGGRRNPALMAALRQALGNAVDTAEDAGWRGDDLEAEAFAFLAVRALRGLPLSLPNTTGVPRPLSGGVVHVPRT